MVDAIGQHLMLWSAGQRMITQVWLDRHQSELLQILRISEEQLLEHVPAELRSVIYAIAPLRFYRLEALRFMLTEQHVEGGERPDGHYLNIVRELDQAAEIAWWHRQSRAYVTSEVVRRLVNRRQLLEDRHRLCCAPSPGIADVLGIGAAVCQGQRGFYCRDPLSSGQPRSS